MQTREIVTEISSNESYELTLLDLPFEAILNIFDHLDTTDITKFLLVSKTTKGLVISAEEFWKGKVKLHFPEIFSVYNTMSVRNWYEMFKIHDAKTHVTLPNNKCKRLFFALKEGDFNAIKTEELKEYISAKDSHGNDLLYWAIERFNDTKKSEYSKIARDLISNGAKLTRSKVKKLILAGDIETIKSIDGKLTSFLGTPPVIQPDSNLLSLLKEKFEKENDLTIKKIFNYLFDRSLSVIYFGRSC